MSGGNWERRECGRRGSFIKCRGNHTCHASARLTTAPSHKKLDAIGYTKTDGWQALRERQGGKGLTGRERTALDPTGKPQMQFPVTRVLLPAHCAIHSGRLPVAILCCCRRVGAILSRNSEICHRGTTGRSSSSSRTHVQCSSSSRGSSS